MKRVRGSGTAAHQQTSGASAAPHRPGHGSCRRQELGIPTANLDRESLHGALAQAVSGIYLGWASVGADTAVHKMVMSIGWNPYYNNEVGSMIADTRC